jgi:hypothetical protein
MDRKVFLGQYLFSSTTGLGRGGSRLAVIPHLVWILDIKYKNDRRIFSNLGLNNET